MIPYKDDNPTGTFPFVTIGIIALNAAFYLWELLSPTGEQEIVHQYGAIPHSLLTFSQTQPIHPVATVFSSMFLQAVFFISGATCCISGSSATT